MLKADKLIGKAAEYSSNVVLQIPHYCTPSIVRTVLSDAAGYVVSVTLLCWIHIFH